MLDFRKGLFQYTRPGFNRQEREWYAQEVINNESLLVAYDELATAIAEILNKPKSAVYDLFMNKDGLPSKEHEQRLMVELGGHLIELRKLDSKQAELARNTPDRIAEMFLRSRLRLDWIKANADAILEELDIDVSRALDHISELPRSAWLRDTIRESLVEEILDMLPGWHVQEIAEAANLEMNEGKELKISADPIDSDPAIQLGKHILVETTPANPTNKNGSSTLMPIASLPDTA